MKKSFQFLALMLAVAAMCAFSGCKSNPQPGQTSDSTQLLEEAQPNVSVIGVIDFDTLPEKVQDGMRGGKGLAYVRSFNDDLNKVIRVKLAPGSSVGLHTHDDSSEIIMVLEGCGIALFDGRTLTLDEGNIHYCPKGHSHAIINDSKEDLVLCCVVPQQ